MSWMDSWSRPAKHSAVPPPLYTTVGDHVKYCFTCGRVMSSGSQNGEAPSKQRTPQKYCSSRCRSQKPSSRDRRIEEAFVTLLQGCRAFEDREVPKAILDLVARSRLKGDSRVIVPCSAVETLIFGSRADPSKTFGRKKSRASRAIALQADISERRSDTIHVVDSDQRDTASTENVEDWSKQAGISTTANPSGVRLPQHLSDVNGSIGGEKGWAERIEETAKASARRAEGMRVAAEKELVKRAARRGCVFGFHIEVTNGKEKRYFAGNHDETRTQKCEAIMDGSVAEPSFAKGDWGIRWRDA